MAQTIEVCHQRWGAAHERPEAAIHAGDHAVSTNDVGVAADPLRDQSRVFNKVRGGIDHAWNQDLLVWNLDRLQVLPFVLVTRVGAFETQRLRAGLEANIDDLAEREVVGVRALVVAPANMKPHRILGDSDGRRIEGFDVAFRNLTEFVIGEVTVLVVARGTEIGGVDLQQKAGRDNRLVLNAHHLGERLQISGLVGIVQIDDKAGENARRRCGHERVRRLGPVDGGGEVRKITLEWRAVRIGEWADASRKRDVTKLHHPLHEVGMVKLVTADHDVTPLLGGARVHRNAGHAVADIHRVGRLAHLAVAHHVDATRDLLCDHVLDRLGTLHLERGRLDLLAALLGENEIDQRLRPRQAADMSS